MLKHSITIIAFLIAAGYSNAIAAAASFPDGTSKMCHLPNGAVVPEVNTPQGFAGLTQPIPTPPGVLISYDVTKIAPVVNAISQFVQVQLRQGAAGFSPADISNAPLFQWKLLAYHECAHARNNAGSDKEVAVNCTAVLSMLNDHLFSAHDVAVQTAAFGTNIGQLRQPLQYGGSLSAFWSDTLSCVNWALNYPGASPPRGTASALTLDPD